MHGRFDRMLMEWVNDIRKKTIQLKVDNIFVPFIALYVDTRKNWSKVKMLILVLSSVSNFWSVRFVENLV